METVALSVSNDPLTLSASWTYTNLCVRVATVEFVKDSDAGVDVTAESSKSLTVECNVPFDISVVLKDSSGGELARGQETGDTAETSKNQIFLP